VIFYLSNIAPQRTQSQTNQILCDLCALCGESNNENQPPIFSSALLPPSCLHSARVPVLICSARSCGVEARGFRLFQQAFGAKFINPDIEITSVIGTVLMIISIYLLGIKTWITGTCVPDVFTTLAFGQRHINI
jgi:hypothetical protein